MGRLTPQNKTRPKSKPSRKTCGQPARCCRQAVTSFAQSLAAHQLQALNSVSGAHAHLLTLELVPECMIHFGSKWNEYPTSVIDRVLGVSTAEHRFTNKSSSPRRAQTRRIRRRHGIQSEGHHSSFPAHRGRWSYPGNCERSSRQGLCGYDSQTHGRNSWFVCRRRFLNSPLRPRPGRTGRESDEEGKSANQVHR